VTLLRAHIHKAFSTKAALGSARRAIPSLSPRSTESFLGLRSELGRSQFSKLRELQPCRPRVHSRDQHASISIEKSQPKHQALQKIPWGGEPHRAAPFAFSFVKHLLRRQR